MICFFKELKHSIREGCSGCLIEFYGYTGSLSIMVAYALTSHEFDKKIWIDIMNLYGSSAVGIVSYRSRVWQAVILEVVWFGIASVSLVRNLTDD